MNSRKFTLYNRIISLVILLVAGFVYLSTIEPTTSFWDCGEFIASSYKLEVGHPPGNPVFQLFARFFTMFTDNMHAAAAVNAMSAICSAFTIFFLYLTIVHLGMRLNEKSGRSLSLANAIAIYGAGVVGALAYCFSDTFWFSAVEAEVYAMSSLFTAVVFWAILKWEEEAESKYANRWIVLISFLMGLSIGVHLLNLLAIPAITFIIYYKKSKKVNWKSATGVLLLSGAIILAVMIGIVQYLPRVAAFFDRIFVNGLGAPFNLGAVIFLVLLLVACFFGMYRLRKKEKAIMHTIVLSFTTILIGFSTFAVVVIRASANTPTNEYQPDNPYTLVRYLSREQYGSNPIIYGQAYTAPYDIKTVNYYTPLDGRYYKAENIEVVFPSEGKMFFPRMWNATDQKYVKLYDTYAKVKNNRTVTVRGQKQVVQMPKFKDNLRFFFDYQLNYMYFRYFMWNFVGRQNDFHGQEPSDLISGNWESGIGFIDRMRLGDQSEAPEILKNNNAKNHYYFLPLILGLIGFFFQLRKDPRNNWVTSLLFILTGIAIVVYLNQQPFQVRERDYAYAGSFYVFTIWIGLAVLAIQGWIEKLHKKEEGGAAIAGAGVATALCLSVAILMGCENWDDHDRSGRYTARDWGYNFLAGTDPNAILITYGDNDTFPLWYQQEVEGVRTDVRIVNTSLLGTDWYIDQMQCRQYESDPLKITIPRIQYLYGTNDYPYVINAIERPILASQAIDIFRNPQYKLSDGKTDFLPAKQLLIPVNKENVKKYGIVAEKDYDKIVDTVVLNINADRIGKTSLIILDFLSTYQWDRPVYCVTTGTDLNLGLENWLQIDGMANKFVPIYTPDMRENPQIDEDKMYKILTETYRFDSLKDTTIHVDYQNIYSFMAVQPIREMFSKVSNKLIESGKVDQAEVVLDMAIDIMPGKNFPYNISFLRSYNELSLIDMMEQYLMIGKSEKAIVLADQFVEETLQMAKFFATSYGSSSLSTKEIDSNVTLLYYVINIFERYDQKEFANSVKRRLVEL
ncbi:MAG TPA: DUF2723 domain-containing protein [Bacteroidales bacterium]|mgnify:FL=1|jgi:hypothetical protein|nr:DUF2723 domain-containing protein [Bacteroidales bacterium]HPY21609.1 DUF2723 domain-containing protein [Bacteroidales bacterium]HQA92864.1 DUF2723 domain-containing protein [Bacteroidales bacterium]HQN24068.1 DUF2723 domain-containing protein [Bacteroidales bacterium]HQP79492.1 DUF2723 domain-containing protein [Bacteroidales bacterium]